MKTAKLNFYRDSGKKLHIKNPNSFSIYVAFTGSTSNTLVSGASIDIITSANQIINVYSGTSMLVNFMTDGATGYTLYGSITENNIITSTYSYFPSAQSDYLLREFAYSETGDSISGNVDIILSHEGTTEPIVSG